MPALLFLVIAAPFALMPVVLGAGGRWRARAGWVALIAPVGATLLLLHLALQHEAGGRAVIELPWIPALGLNLTFVLDGLSLFFGLIVSGMGVLVVFYAQYYLDDHYRHHDRFYAYLLLFMGAMLGTVFSGNVLLLVVFWEMTGLASFLLIGFFHDKAESRDGARMALLVTGGTGLVLLAGVVLLGHVAGTYELAALLDGAARGKSQELLNTAFVLIAIGAFGKSAQFPFQFWLPNAMAAPTPVSAYLHSATMVKLGVFLIARIFPVFREVELWEPLLMVVCFGTMLLAAVLALLSHNLKAILAYSTVSQLGFLIGYYGMAAPEGAQGDLLHIANHVFYKGCLFMVVGIIYHSTGTHDIRELGGLARRLPVLLGITAVATATMAGLPGTLGFISKEYLLKEKFDHWESGAAMNWFPLVIVALAAAIQVAFAIRLVWGMFGGRIRPAVEKRFHAPGWAIQLPPFILAACSLAFGLLPGVFGRALQILHTPGLHHPEQLHFTIWHGVTPELVMSGLIVLAGGGLFALLQIGHWRWAAVPRWLQFDLGFEHGVKWLPEGGRRLGALLRFDRQFDFIAIVLGATAILMGSFWWAHRAALWPARPVIAEIDPLRAFVVALIAVAVAMVIFMRRWTSQLIAVSIVGFLVTFYYVLFRAPDLAMTQVLVETATLLLVLLLLARFPRSAQLSEIGRAFSRMRQMMNVAIAVAVGGLTTLCALMVMRQKHGAPAGDFYLQNTVELAHGANAVNTILVDFRSIDTLFEITVLLIACLGSLGLLMRHRRTAGECASGAMGPAGYRIGRKPEPKEERPQ